MKKKIIFIFIFYFLTHCSFDTKTGIWDNSNEIALKKEKEPLEGGEWKEVFAEKKELSDEKSASKNFKIKAIKPYQNKNWSEEYFNSLNNIPNLVYLNNKNIVLKSSKIAKKNTITFESKFLLNDDNVISSSLKGNIFSYSLFTKKKNWEYNFYKKKYKKFSKKLNFIINNRTIFVSDNLGYMYALNLENGKLIWAKNFGIPFRSNMKIVGNQILLANQDNLIYSVNLNTGLINWKYSTSSSVLKSSFKNNFALDMNTNSLFFLNTSGELYSIDYTIPKINWFISLKQQSTDDNLNLFHAQPITMNNDVLLVATKNNLTLFNKITGTKNWEIPMSTSIKPSIFQQYAFVISKNFLLTCIDISDGKIIWSKKILESIKDIKIKVGEILASYVINNKLFIFSNNGSILAYDLNNGQLLDAFSVLKNKILIEPLVVNGHFYLLNNKNKIIKVD